MSHRCVCSESFGLFVFVLSCGLCQGAEANDKSEISSPIADGIRLAAELPKESKAGDAILLKIRLENQGIEPMGGISRSKYRDYHFEVFDEKGKHVKCTSFGSVVMEKNKGGSASDFTLEPGRKFEETINLTHLFDLSMPAEYEITISRCVSVGAGAAPKFVELKAGAARFKIGAPEH